MSYRDREKAETICKIEQLVPVERFEINHGKEYNYIESVDFQPGDVLVDSRGTGAVLKLL